MKLIQELNERAMLQKIGNWLQNAGVNKIIKALDSGTKSSEMAMNFNQISDKKQKALKDSIKNYLKDNEHKGLERFYGMVGGK